MKVAVVGGGPAGLYFALLLKKADPAHQVTVLERNPQGATFGWGVVFSDQTLGNFQAADPETFREISASFARWDDIDVHFKGRTITSGGHGFAGLARAKLLEILQRRAAGLGVDLRFGVEVRDDSDLPALGLGDADLIVGADGVNSAIRRRHADVFHPDLVAGKARYVWLGTTRLFDAFTFIFVENRHGIFQAHAYRFSDRLSAFIVECDELSWRNAGFDRLDVDATIAACEEMFGPWLAGHRLAANVPPHQRAAPWQQFVRVHCAPWWHDNIVLIGDAAHTAHFSIGSGTKLAMEDAIALARIVQQQPDLRTALPAYEEERRTEALRLQNAARNSMEWFENVRRYARLDPEQLAYSLLTRSQRVSHENLRLRDRAYLEGVERWFAGREEPPPPPPPMFTPFTLRGMTVENRVVVSPMDMYSAEDGTPNDFHLVHLGARALGGAGLLITEMTCVSPEGRISPGCTGMYRPEHAAAWRRITHFVHERSRAKICLQLGHSGAKGSTRRMWEGMDEPLPEGNWPVMAASAVPFKLGLQVPREMTRADMDQVRDEFVRAVRMAIEAGFDMLELHCAHGYLLSGFITPLSNRRTDEYGGALENRLRFPLEVFRALREVWPRERPASVRISATDWVAGGVDGPEAVEIARAFHLAGADIIHVSAGQTSADARPVYGRMFQTPLSDRIRNETGIPTIAVGNITEPDQVNSIIAAGRADLCALARPHLADPAWTLRAAAQLGYTRQPWPVQYLSGKEQLERNLARQRQAELLGTSTI
ncbi:MAG TPA: bifunctional salicylyl-CoA 5-hydroxylase/oxidoreductase [Thermoanaerobaculia bacterium]|jgi:anthraniloyl-CoA monooxygenase|nr:bifunctional salicylyl-CoA 5-hydroxylase/oxidoreductase [Thermoanaerobaculia bacterium]